MGRVGSQLSIELCLVVCLPLVALTGTVLIYVTHRCDHAAGHVNLTGCRTVNTMTPF